MFTLVTILKVKKQTLHTYLPLSVLQRCALHSSCSGCERRSAGKQSGDVTALLSGCPALTARPEKQSAEDRQRKLPDVYPGYRGPRDRWSLESCLCDSSPATKQRRCSDPDRCRYRCSVAMYDGCGDNLLCCRGRFLETELPHLRNRTAGCSAQEIRTSEVFMLDTSDVFSRFCFLVNRLIQQNSHIFSDSHCKVCSAVLISESQKLAHYQSKKHANKYRRYTSIHQGEDFTPAKKMKADDDTEQNASDSTDRNKCCPVCNMTFSSPVVAMSHYIGKTHSKNLKMLEQGGVSQAPSVRSRRLPALTDQAEGGAHTICVIAPSDLNSQSADRCREDGAAPGGWNADRKRLDDILVFYAENELKFVHALQFFCPGFGNLEYGVPRVPKPAAPRVIPENTDKSDPEKFCQLCSATFNNPHMAEQHYKGRRHLKQETKNKLMTVYSSSGNTLPKNAPLNPVTPGSGATGSWSLLRVKHNDIAIQDAGTDRYRSKVAQCEAGNWYSCDTCNVVLNSIEQYEAHVSGSKHRNK
ncbi:unnamed protein product [Ranitomeya imitator]|uniref:Zinc finger protein 346 n=1 Tax=Ranitomeya imitator TaxID=111125 RepID=A0ABN9LMK8_9NEOB|nr:unnamed protein product [Ranitomeya imitator]